jgi:DNA-binding response OmpR family regulator
VSNKILVVEDERDYRDFLDLVLRLEGYEVSTANDGMDALKKIKSDCPDLVVSDLCMPKLDGIDLVKRIREIPDCESVPVVILSALGNSNLTQAVIAGANEAMPKPVDIDVLLNSIEGWLDKAA